MSEEPSLTQLLNEDTQVLFSVSTVFPFDLFPTKVVVYSKKVDIIDRIFFASTEIKSILINDILEVEVQTTPFFSSMTIVSRMPMMPTQKISTLKTSDALKLRSILQGLLIAGQQHADMGETSPGTLKRQAEKLGSAAV